LFEENAEIKSGGRFEKSIVIKYMMFSGVIFFAGIHIAVT
jgi:hypothetical protein